MCIIVVFRKVRNIKVKLELKFFTLYSNNIIHYFLLCCRMACCGSGDVCYWLYTSDQLTVHNNWKQCFWLLQTESIC